MGRLIQLLLIAAVVYVTYRLIRGTLFTAAPRSRFKCASCRNCKQLFDDGVICAFGRKETFKNETHIANCRDWARGRMVS